MNPIKLFIIIFLFIPYYCNAVGSEEERKQLEEFNHDSEVRFNNAINIKSNSVNAEIESYPEYKEAIIALEIAWDNMILKKCLLDTIESAHTEAEVAAKNTCLTKEYEAEANYFKHALI